MSRIVAPAAALALLLSSCALPGEYNLYRAYRYQSSGASRTVAGRRYLDAYPDGRYAVEVRAALADLGESLSAPLPGIVASGGSATTGPSESARPPERPRTELLRWLGAALALRDWNQAFSLFLGANGGFSDAFDSEPVPRCDPFGCTKTVPVVCAASSDGAPARGAAIRVTLIVRSNAVVGVDLALDFDAFALLRVCEQGTGAIDAGGLDATPMWALGEIRESLLREFPSAQSTPDALRGDALDRAQPGPVDSSPGRVRWSYLLRCDARAYLRVDGFSDARHAGDGGIRLWSIPLATIAALGAQADVSPELRAESSAAESVPAAMPSNPRHTMLEPIRVDPRNRDEDPDSVPVTVLAPRPYDIAFLAAGEPTPSVDSARWDCRTPCSYRTPRGANRIAARANGVVTVHVLNVWQPATYRLRPDRSRGIAIALLATSLASAAIGGILIASSQNGRSSGGGMVEAGIIAETLAAGGLAGAWVAGTRSRRPVLERVPADVFATGSHPRFAAIGVMPTSGGAAAALQFEF